MVGVEDGVVKPYDAHRTIHIDAAKNPGQWHWRRSRRVGRGTGTLEGG
jgi:hypothetical protein